MGFLATLLLLMAAPEATASCPASASPELLKLALPGMKAEAVEIKPWKKAFCVALVATAESEEKRAYGVALFAAGDASLSKRLKASSGPLLLGENDSAAHLDLAKYDVTPTQTAIGVRVQRHRIYLHANEANLETLVLFVSRGRQLEPILDAFMSYDAEMPPDREDATEEEKSRPGYYEGKATLGISKTITNGHFDLIRKTDSGTQHLRWDGDAYVGIDPDPFTKNELDIFDPH